MAFKTKVLEFTWRGFSEYSWVCPLCSYTLAQDTDQEYMVGGVHTHLKEFHFISRDVKVKVKSAHRSGVGIYIEGRLHQPFDPSNLPHGVYEIFWIGGGSSLASIGSYSDGRRWFAPTNWVSGESGDWSAVARVELIESKTRNTFA